MSSTTSAMGLSPPLDLMSEALPFFEAFLGALGSTYMRTNRRADEKGMGQGTKRGNCRKQVSIDQASMPFDLMRCVDIQQANAPRENGHLSAVANTPREPNSEAVDHRPRRTTEH